MYKKEEKERILAEINASGMTVREFCRLPGTPTHTSVYCWLKEQRDGSLDVPSYKAHHACEHRKHARYPAATRKEALRLHKQGMRPYVIARRLGLASGSTVSQWAKKAAQAKMEPEGVKAMKRKSAPSSEELARLEEELAEAQMENRVLRELMRDPKSEDPANLSNLQKTELGERLRRVYGYSLRQVIGFLKMPKSTYEYNRKRIAKKALRAEEVAKRVRHAFEHSKRRYGYRRVWASIRMGSDGLEPMELSQREVRDAMSDGRMCPHRTKKKEAYSSYTGENGRRPANLPLKEDGTHGFTTDKPNMMVVTDVTEFKVGSNSKVYLSPIIDCFDGKPAAWRSGTMPDAEMCKGSLQDYIRTLPDGHDPITAHSDGGGQYFSDVWIESCEEMGIMRSMSRKGTCGDNARAEGFFGTLKEEFYNCSDWSSATIEQFQEALNNYLNWYCEGRLKAFSENGKTLYDTIEGRRKRLGLAA